LTTNELDRVRTIVDPIASDLGLDLYDVERRGATMRVTLDTPPGADGGITLDTLALATRIISRELDHVDPIPGRYTLEVTSPGLERQLRRPEHFRREVGKEVLFRLRDVAGDDRRVRGTLVAADDSTATVRVESGEERVVDLTAVDTARTVFEWGPGPKPGKGSRSGKRSGGSGKRSGKGAGVATPGPGGPRPSEPASNKEKQSS
jgi:ribosome maturation factor RimP